MFENKLKPFNLEQALKGKKVVDNKGEEVTQIHAFTFTNGEVKIGGVQTNFRYVGVWNPEWLFMALEKKVGWVNIYAPKTITGVIFDTKEQADSMSSSKRVACVKVEWEE